MQNPNNNVGLRGKVTDSPVPVIKNGVPVAITFGLLVDRFCTWNGERKYDVFQVKYCFHDSQTDFALSLKQGDQISLVGSLYTEWRHGTAKVCVRTDSIIRTERAEFQEPQVALPY